MALVKEPDNVGGIIGEYEIQFGTNITKYSFKYV